MSNMPPPLPHRSSNRKRNTLAIDLLVAAVMLFSGALASALVNQSPRFAVMLLSGATVGAVVGLIPFIIARKRGMPRLARMALAGCAASGAVLGIVLALPVSVALTVVILMKRPKAPSVSTAH